MNKKHLHQVVDHLLAIHAQRIAVEQPGRSCSYLELDRRSAALAGRLRGLGIGRGDVVALPMPASIDYVVALLAVVRSGAIFMPLDPAFPLARLRHMLTLAAPKAVVGSDAAAVDRIVELVGATARIVLDGTEPGDARPAEITADEDDTGYLIATSGSTGEPKLIAGRNKGISHFVHWEVAEFGIGDDVRASFLAPPTFDVSLREIFVPLLAGGTLVIPSAQVRADARRLAGWLCASRITLMHCVPSLLRLLTRALADGAAPGPLTDLRVLALAGEPLYGADVAAWRRVAGAQAEMVNLYGPSETTLAKAFFRIGDDIAPDAIVPLGQPISNTALLLLRDNRLCEIGEIGELHVLTPFASNGYWGRPELTQQAFIENPLGGDGTQRIYRTGDLGRYRADRSVEFAGRSDRQVKVNGVRIELAEIEIAMRGHLAVTEAVAHTFRLADGENSLVGYFTCDAPLDPMVLRESMRATLPDNMLPAYLVQLPEFPRNLNGKVDRRALPRPQALLASEHGFVAPEGQIEQEIARMWADALGLERVGAASSYLQIGGNSLRAIGLIGRIGQRFKVDLSIRDFFEAATVRALAARVSERAGAAPAIPAAPEQDDYPLTDAQAGLWLLDRIDGSATLYNNVEWLELRGALDPAALEAAFGSLVQRHEALRTAFVALEGEPRQRVLPAGGFTWQFDAAEAATAPARLLDLLQQERGYRFDLAGGLLLRVHLVRESAQLHHLVINMHHIACDGWSMALLVRELVAAYQRLAAGADPKPPAHGNTEPGRRIRDLATWLASRPVAKERAEAWRARLANAEQRAAIPPDQEPDDVGGNPLGAGRVTVVLPAQQMELLRTRLAGQGATPFMGIAAALSILLYRYGGSETVIIGTPLAGRSRGELAGTVGFMVNTLPLALALFPELGFGALLERTRQAVEGLADGEFDTPARWAAPPLAAAEPGRNPFYDVVLAMEPGPAPIAIEGLQVIEHEVAQPPARNDLSLRLQDDGATLTLHLEYRRTLYCKAAMGSLLKQLVRLLERGSEEPSLALKQLPMLEEAQLQALSRLERGPSQPRLHTSIDGLFAQRVRAAPQSTALVTFDTAWSYQALDHRANRIAIALRDGCAVQPGDIVAVLLEREPDWPATILAIFKLGAVYLPLDPWQPSARHAALIDDAGAKALVTRGSIAAACRLLDLENVIGSDPVAPGATRSAQAPAYLIYTSGSTGAPKGVLVSHGAFLNMIEDQIDALEVGSADTVLQFVAPAFDVSMFEIFLALLSGARLALADRRACNTPHGFAEAVSRLQVSVAAMTPGFLNSLGDVPLRGLRLIVSGGEPPIAADWQRRIAAGIRYINAYGPTEASVCAAFHEIDPAWPQQQVVPIGRPTANTSLHVVAPDLSPLPQGAVGELAISGASLALGYARQPHATDAAFVSGSLAAGGARLYRTGDRVRRLPNGSIVFVGRKDSQVKVRGHRLEIGEVEAAIRRQSGVRDARVVTRPIGMDTELLGYWVGNAELDEAGLHAALARQLPEYMIPRRLQRLDALPLNPNGKLDASRLPELALRADPAASGAPRGPQEQALAALWSELLDGRPVGRDDNFFELGGRSLAANRLALRAARALDACVELRDIYAAPTPAALAERLRSSARAVGAVLPRLPEDRPALPSPMQRRLWVIDQLGESGSAYHIAGLMRLSGELDVAALRLAFQDLATRHAVLRTRFVAEAGEPMLACDPPGPVPWTEWDAAPGAAPQARLEELAAQAFDLARDWPLRVALAREAGDAWLLLIVLHHIAADGWSMPILQAELGLAYAARRSGAAPAWLPLPAQYRDIAAWMDQRLNAGAHERDRDYWARRLEAPLPLLDLPTDCPRPAVRRFEGATLERALHPSSLEAAQRLASSHGSTLFTVLLCALQTLLYRLSGQDDLVIGVPVSGRSHPASEGLAGFFVNTLALRERIDGSKGFGARLTAAARSLREDMAHQDYPFDRLVGDLQVARDPSRSAIFDVMIGLDEPGAGPVLDGLAIESLPLARRGSRCDMAWMFGVAAGSAVLRLEFDTALFEPARIDDWIGRFENLLRAAAADPAQALDRLELLRPQEREQLLLDSAAPPTPLPEATVIQLFEAQAAANERQVALRTDDARWTYGELNRAANRLARQLQRVQGKRERPVALLCGRGPLMVVAQLAVMKCGSAYLPIEPDAPRARVELLLADSGAQLLLVDPMLMPQWLQAGAQCPGLQVMAVSIAQGEDDTNLGVTTQPDDPIYVMYTSGSTGRPKGVVARHRGVVRLVQGCLYYAPQPGDRLLQLSNYAFDGATFDFYAALTNGLTLCLPTQDVLHDSTELAAFMRRHDVTVTFITTALFNRVVDDTPDVLAQFRRLYFGGQDASLPHTRRALERMAAGALVHVYGPTECTTFATWHTVTPADLKASAVRLPIGKPIGHTQAHVLDRFQMLLPPGTPGELCIAGVGLAAGYLGQAAATAERFVASPFQAGERLYRTGDLCIQRTDGVIEFLGRMDGQVKIRGFRVEPGEVEHHIGAAPGVGLVHVLPRRNASGNVELIAYLTAAQPQQPPALAAVLAHLEQALPRYMQPAHFVLLEALPLNRNGKVDARALPAPEAGSMAGHAPVRAAGNDPAPSAAERLLLDAWTAVLGRTGIGLHDNYYTIGGDSIQAIQIGARLRNQGFSLKVTDLMRYPTIAQLAPLLGAGAKVRVEQPLAADGAIALTPIQHWMLELQLPAPGHFNQSVLLRLPAASDTARVQRALSAIEAAHSTLRLRFGTSGASWQTLTPARGVPPDVGVTELGGADALRRMHEDINRVQASLLPETGPIWRAKQYRLVDGDRLLLTIHHWAVDGVSWRILLEDFSDAWQQALDPAGVIRLPAGTDSFARWSQAVGEAACSAHFLAQRDYWNQQAATPVGELPRLGQAPAAPLGERLVLEHVLDAGPTEALFGACHDAYRTRADELLLAAWVRALTQVQGHAACRLLLESHGREALAGQVDVGRTVGWFTAIYPLAFTLRGSGWQSHIREVKETLRSVPDHGIGFGLLRYLSPEPRLASPEAEVVFNYLGRFEHRQQGIELADESTGDELDPRIRLPQGLDVSAEVRDGRLRLRLVGDTGRHPPQCFHALRDALAEALDGVIAHCLSPQVGGLSPSDVDLDGIGIDDLDGILDSLEAP